MKNISDHLLGSTFTKDAITGTEKVVINKNDQSPEVYLRFIHTKKAGGTLTVNIYKAQFDGDLQLNYESEKPTTVNYEFVAMADNDLNYVEFEETFPEE